MDTFQSALLPSRLPMPLASADKFGGAGAGRVSNESLPPRSNGGPRRDFVVEFGGGLGRQGIESLDQLSAAEGLGLYTARGRTVRPSEQAEPGSEARLRSALQDLGLSSEEVEDVVHVSRMLARISPEAARRLEEGLRAMAGAGDGDGDGASPMERLGGRNGLALDYMKLEFSYTDTTETTVQNADGTITRQVSPTQIDLSFERLEMAFRGKADDAPAFFTLDGDDLAFGAEPSSPNDNLSQMDFDSLTIQSLMEAMSEFRHRGEDDDEDRFGLKSLAQGARSGAEAGDTDDKSVELLFS